MENLEEPIWDETITSAWKEDLIFAALGDATRRRIFLSLAKNGPQTAKALQGGARRGFSATLKHLSVMCDSGLVEKQVNPADARKPLYAVHPKVPMTRTGNLVIVDFVHFMFRFRLK